MKYLVVACILAAACKSNNEPTKSAEQVQKDFKDDLAKDLMDAKRRGPGFAIKPDATPRHDPRSPAPRIYGWATRASP